MNMCSSISRHKGFNLLYPVTIAVVSVTMQNTTSSWMILCIDVVSIPFFGDALPMMTMNKCWMISTLEHVVVIYLGWLQPRKSFALDISGLLSSKNVIGLVNKCPPCQHVYPKKRTHPALLHPVIAIGPFSKWGIDFIHCKPTSSRGMVTSS